MLDQLLSSLPKTVLAIGVMIIALVVFRQIQPPRSICDAQIEIFRDSQKKFLYASVPNSEGIALPSNIKRFTDVCKGDNSPGGCFELFLGLRKMAVDIKNIPDQCAEKASEEPEIDNWLWKSLKLMVQIAWGDRAPASYLQKNGWYDASEVTLFCDLRRQAIRIYGNERFSEWQETALKDLPKAEQFSREQVWQRNILSTACDLYR